MDAGEDNFRVDFSFNLNEDLYEVMIIESNLFRYRTNHFDDDDLSLLKIEEDGLYFKHPGDTIFTKDRHPNANEVIEKLRRHYFEIVEKPFLE